MCLCVLILRVHIFCTIFFSFSRTSRIQGDCLQLGKQIEVCAASFRSKKNCRHKIVFLTVLDEVMEFLAE